MIKLVVRPFVCPSDQKNFSIKPRWQIKGMVAPPPPLTLKNHTSLEIEGGSDDNITPVLLSLFWLKGSVKTQEIEIKIAFILVVNNFR